MMAYMVFINSMQSNAPNINGSRGTHVPGAFCGECVHVHVWGTMATQSSDSPLSPRNTSCTSSTTCARDRESRESGLRQR